MWLTYWKFVHDPFVDQGSPFVPTATHAEGVARLVHTIESADRAAEVRGEEGAGKSCILRQALEESRSPLRRHAQAVCPVDGPTMLAGLARGLGARIPLTSSRAEAWQALVDAVRLCRVQRLQVILAVDGCEALQAPDDRLDLARLVHIDPHPSARVTIVRVQRSSAAGDLDSPLAAGLRVRVGPLLRSDVERYVVSKLAAAGRADPTFTPRAFNRLHFWTRGNPANINRLASLAMVAAAMRGLEIVTPDVVDGASLEYCPVAVDESF